MLILNKKFTYTFFFYFFLHIIIIIIKNYIHIFSFIFLICTFILLKKLYMFYVPHFTDRSFPHFFWCIWVHLILLILVIKFYLNLIFVAQKSDIFFSHMKCVNSLNFKLLKIYYLWRDHLIFPLLLDVNSFST